MLEKELEELLEDTKADRFLYEISKKTGEPISDLNEQQIIEVIGLWNSDQETIKYVTNLLKSGKKKELLRLLAPEKYSFQESSSVSLSKSARYVKTNDFHEHDYFEIECVLDGSANHHSLFGDYRLEKDDIVLIPPHVKHDLDVIGKSTIINLGIRSSTFRNEFSDILKHDIGVASYFEKIMYGTFNSEVIIRKSLDSFMIELILMMYQKNKEHSLNNDIISKHLITCFIFRMFECSRKELIYDISRSSDIKASQMKRYIYDHLETITLDDLSNHFYMSNAYISRYLKEKLHSGFLDILKEARMDKAKELLIKTDMPILQIAQKVGYSSQSHFIQLFHKATGLSPLQYRFSKTSKME